MTPKMQKKIEEMAVNGSMDMSWEHAQSYIIGAIQGAKDYDALVMHEVQKLLDALEMIALDNIHVGENGWRNEHFLDVKQAQEAIGVWLDFMGK